MGFQESGISGKWNFGKMEKIGFGDFWIWDLKQMGFWENLISKNW